MTATDSTDSTDSIDSTDSTDPLPFETLYLYGGGFGYPFYMGGIAALNEKYKNRLKGVRLIGTSISSVILILHANGVDTGIGGEGMDIFDKEFKQPMSQMKNPMSAISRLESTMKYKMFVENILSRFPETWTRLNNQQIQFGISICDPDEFVLTVPFTSNNDVFEAVMCSSNILGLFDYDTLYDMRDGLGLRRAFDGGNFFDYSKLPPNTKTLTINGNLSYHTVSGEIPSFILSHPLNHSKTIRLHARGYRLFAEYLETHQPNKKILPFIDETLMFPKWLVKMMGPMLDLIL